MIYTGHDNSSCRWWPTLQPSIFEIIPHDLANRCLSLLYSLISRPRHKEGGNAKRRANFAPIGDVCTGQFIRRFINHGKFREEGAANDKGNRWRGKLHREMVAKTRFRLIDSIPRHFERARVFLYVSTPSPWGKSKISRNSGDEATTYEVKVVASVIQSWRPS